MIGGHLTEKRFSYILNYNYDIDQNQLVGSTLFPLETSSDFVPLS
jgi:hypothetical protein